MTSRLKKVINKHSKHSANVGMISNIHPDINKDLLSDRQFLSNVLSIVVQFVLIKMG